MKALLAIAVLAVTGLVAVGCTSTDDAEGTAIDGGRIFDVEGHRTRDIE